ncbi:MAG: hypothetical protein IID48_05395, partial [Proteobacteria bacterium]|nr:hypothetical protein [Pseudomonadota bacterium]
GDAGPKARAGTPPAPSAPISLLPPAAPEPKPADPSAAPEKAPGKVSKKVSKKAGKKASGSQEAKAKAKTKTKTKTVARAETAPAAVAETKTKTKTKTKAGFKTKAKTKAHDASLDLVSSSSAPVLIETSPMPGKSLSHGVPRVLRFDWPEGTAAAAFRRGGKLWLVFDRPPPGDLAGNISRMAPELEPVEQFEVAGATVIRFAAPAMLTASLRRENAAWIVELRPGIPDGGTEFEALVEGSAERARVVYRVERPGRTVSFIDPDLGDRLIVVPVPTARLGLGVTREFPQFRVLASRQGLVFQPLSESLQVEVTAKAVVLRDSEGLIVSRGSSLALLKSNVSAPRRGPRLFDLEAWRRGDVERFQVNKQMLQGVLARAEPAHADAARFELARFYFAHGLASEALGMLRLAGLKGSRMASDPRLRLVEGASEFLTDDLAAAAAVLYHPSLAGEWEADLWRAALAAARLDWGRAAAGFAQTEALIAAYPHAVRVRLRLLAAEAGLAVGDREGAERYLEAVRRDDPSHTEKAQVAFLVARLLHLDGDTETAAELWRRVAASKHPPSRIRARLALLDLALEDGSTTAEQAIDELESLRFAWRGDRFEFALLQRLGDLYVLRGDYRKGLRLLRRAASHTPNSESSQAAASRMRAIFINLFSSEAGAKLPPLRVLALFEEFKELTPPGPKGDVLILRLVDRLVAVDLLDRAAGILESQVEYRLRGTAKARVAARLASVRLSNQEPAKAVAVLNASALPDLPDDLVGERRILRSRALLQLDRADEALVSLSADDSAESLRLRARILLHQENWPAAVLVLERLVPLPPPERPLREAESDAVLDLAVALTMAGERDKILALGRTYEEGMSRGPNTEAFALLVGDLEPNRVKSAAEELAQVDQVEAFLASSRKRAGASGRATTP